MVILYFNKNVSKKTIYLKEPIRGSKIRLVHCKFTNRLLNLPSIATISNENDVVLVTFQKGNYDAEQIIKKIDDANKGISIVLIGENYKLISNSTLHFNDIMSIFLGVPKIYKKPGPSLNITFQPVISEIYLHCNLIDPNDTFYNGNKTQILDCIFLDKINEINIYKPSLSMYTNLNCSEYINAINISITDCENRSVDTKNYDICMTIEII